VVIPAYKAEPTIGRALRSVFAQTRPPDEVIVIDDGSPDNLAAAIEPYKERVAVIRKANGGAASARNLGIDRAQGALIAFLDADDFWYPNKLELQLDAWKRHPELGLVAGWFHEQQPGGARTDAELDRRYFDRILRTAGADTFHIATQIWTGTVVVRRDMLGEGRFVSGLEPAEDRDLWIRFAANHPVYLISEPLAAAVLEPNSLSRSSIDVDCRNMLRVIDRNRGLLDGQGLRYWRALTYRRWAANHLGQGRPRTAIRAAWQRLRLQPWSCEGWWILAKCGAKACISSPVVNAKHTDIDSP
jgi:glycosyltransferase involved in cell wall biosynthesis